MDHPIGKPVPRKEGRKKVTGQALYVDDLSFPDMLHGVTVRSPAARGKITNISFGGDIPWDEFIIVTAKDVPGANYVALILNDQPYLADGFVNHPEEPVVLLAHADKYLLEEARRHVHSGPPLRHWIPSPGTDFTYRRVRTACRSAFAACRT